MCTTQLSCRQIQTWLYYSFTGFSGPEIADFMGISHETVKSHIRAVYEKLGLENGSDPKLGTVREPRRKRGTLVQLCLSEHHRQTILRDAAPGARSLVERFARLVSEISDQPLGNKCAETQADSH